MDMKLRGKDKLNSQQKDDYEYLSGDFNIHMYGWSDSDVHKIARALNRIVRRMDKGVERPEDSEES